MTDVADKLREARALIERGWCQGQARIGDSYCILGACGQVIGSEEVNYMDLRDALIEATGARLIVSWNDAPDRTQAEVLAAFDKAITLAEAGQ